MKAALQRSSQKACTLADLACAPPLWARFCPCADVRCNQDTGSLRHTCPSAPPADRCCLCSSLSLGRMSTGRVYAQRPRDPLPTPHLPRPQRPAVVISNVMVSLRVPTPLTFHRMLPSLDFSWIQRLWPSGSARASGRSTSSSPA